MDSDMTVEVKRSSRRHKTVEARLVDGTLRIAIPSWMSATEEAHWIEVMQQRFSRRSGSDRIDLPVRAAGLATRFGLPEPAAIIWSARQKTRWGSCTIESRRVRISDRLVDYPDWVIDYVIVHELAHLLESGHTLRFWSIVNRYPLAERARGYLLARAELGD
jgi:predicted metal-dependent hydrolase